MRNPVGPLPSSIYWRRRAVALALVAMLVLLVVWALNIGGGGGNQAGKAGEDDRGEGAASSITPGPTTSESMVSERPGGRDEDDEDEGGAGSGSGGGSGDTGSDDAKGSDGSDDADSDDGANAGGSGGGGDVAGLSACRSGQAKVSLVAVKNAYAPDEQPKLRLTVENTSGSACKVNVNGDNAVFTIVDIDDKTIWASDHCAPQGRTELRVAAREKTTHTISWKRERSAASCATPSGGAPKAGTYLAQVEIPGLGTAQTSFMLAKD